MRLSLLKQTNFKLYVIGKFISLLGSNMLQFAISLYVLSVTGSAVIFASMLSILIIPRLLLTPIAGVFGDWFDRKRSIVFLDFTNGFLISVYSILFFAAGRITVPLLYAFVILLEITELFFQASISAILPSILKKEDLVDASSAISLINSIGNLLSPIIASVLYGVFGFKIILLISAIAFFLSALCKLCMKVPKNQKAPKSIDLKTFKEDLAEGITAIRKNKFISSIIGIGTIVNFCIGPLFSIGLLYVLKEDLKLSDYQYGIYQTVLAVSMFAAPLLASSINKKIKIGRLTFLSLLITGILSTVMSLGPSGLLRNLDSNHMVSYLFITGISFFIGFFITVLNIATGALFNQIVPMELMGRVSSVLNLAMTVFIPVGQMIFGFLYDIIPSEYVILFSGVVMVAAVLGYRNILCRIDEESEAEGGTTANEVSVS